MNICVFGDSVAKGVVYDEGKKKYTYLKECFVNRFSRENKVPVQNYARFGCTVTKGAEILDKHRSMLEESAYTVLEFGGNDCDLCWPEISENPSAPHLPNVPLTQFCQCYADMIEKVKASGSIPILFSLPPLDANRFLDWVSQGLSKENILRYLGDVDFIYRWHESYNTAVEMLSKLHRTLFIDIRRAFLAADDFRGLLCRDGMHPNEKGHALINAAIGRHLPLLLPQ